jgi:hypothetical protein
VHILRERNCDPAIRLDEKAAECGKILGVRIEAKVFDEPQAWNLGLRRACARHYRQGTGGEKRRAEAACHHGGRHRKFRGLGVRWS